MEVDDDVGFEDQDLGDQFIQNFHDANTQNAVKMMMGIKKEKLFHFSEQPYTIKMSVTPNQLKLNLPVKAPPPKNLSLFELESAKIFKSLSPIISS